MEENPLISIIIPFYNDEKWIRKCLNSVQNQTYQNLEIILINDGSKDKSPQIVQEYCNLDGRFHIIHQRNQGLSAARNAGIANSIGEYISFIDADDYVSKDYVSYLFGLLKKDHFRSPLAICSYKEVYDDSGITYTSANNSESVSSGKQCLEMMCYGRLVSTCAYAKLGKRSLYNDHFFPEGEIYEDLGSTYTLFEQSPRVLCGFKANYFYQIHSNTILSQEFSTKRLIALHFVDTLASSVTFKFPDLENATQALQISIRLSLIDQINDNQYTQVQKEMVRYIHNHKMAVLLNHKYPLIKRLAVLFLLISTPLYKSAFHIYRKLSKRQR